MSTYTGATAFPDTQPRSQTFAQRSAGLSEDRQKILRNYAGNTEESRSLVLTRLEEDLRNQPSGDLIRVTRREGTNGRSGGIEVATCRDCPFSGTFQKVAEHVTSQHWELGLWSCTETTCKLKYRRKQDLNRHHSEAHRILGPRRSKKLALQGPQAGEHTTSQLLPAYAPPSIRNRHEQQASYMAMSPMGSRSKPRRYGERPSSPSPSPPPSSGTSSPIDQPYQHQAVPPQYFQPRFSSSPIAGHIIPYQRQESYIRAPHVCNDQPGSDFYPFMHGIGGMHTPYQHTAQTVRDAKSIKKVSTTQGGVQEVLEPGMVSITSTAGLTKTKSSGPLGQFQICLVKPLVRFLTMPYLRAQRILQLSRAVHVFHMQSIYIARQAIHLVITLNDLVDVQEGPDDEQYQERIDLEDELIELFDAMREWGANHDEGLQVDYDQGILKIHQQYAQFFRERFYFHNVRNSADDFIYGKLVAYDQKTIDFRRWQYLRTATPMDVDYTDPRPSAVANLTRPSSLGTVSAGAQ